eukprot:m.12280 g.12280  ORF g.12280 m.12280 type:complete len:104 (-) comp7150_c2_seq1:15-326(-)
MLQHLSGNTHYVVTAVAFAYHKDGELVVDRFHNKTNVAFAVLSEEQMEHYIEHGDWHDKAGGYGIQSVAAAFIKEIEGDYYTVVGFPIQMIAEKMCKWIEQQQ